MKTVKIKDKKFSIFISSDKIQKSIDDIAQKINNDVKGKTPLFVVVLNGAFMFAAELLKEININCEISFVKFSSYKKTKSSLNVKKLIGLNEDIKGRTLIIVEDIVDSGITMDNFINDIKKYEPKDIKIATLLYKPKAFTKNFKVDYVGIEIPNDFVVGHGLDYDGLGRNLTDIYKIIE